MPLKPELIGPVPEETARIAHAAFPKGNLYLRLRDELSTLYQDDLFTDLFPARGQPAEVLWRLALVTVMQFLEGLSDRQPPRLCGAFGTCFCKLKRRMYMKLTYWAGIDPQPDEDGTKGGK